MKNQNVLVENKEGIARIVINRPPVNVLDFEILREINSALEEIREDEKTRVVIIRGSGNRAFSAGVEIKDHIGDMMPKTIREFGKTFELLRSLGKPSIAAVNGVAFGGGFEDGLP